MRREYVIFGLLILPIALTVMPGIAGARSTNSSSTGRYLTALLFESKYNRLISVDIGDYRYFDTRFNTEVNTRYVIIRATSFQIPGAPPPPPPLTIAQKVYGPDEDFGLNFNFGEKPSFQGEIDGEFLSVVLNTDSKMDEYQYNTPSYLFNQQQKYGSASVAFSGWPVWFSLPVEGWDGSVMKSVVIPLD